MRERVLCALVTLCTLANSLNYIIKCSCWADQGHIAKKVECRCALVSACNYYLRETGNNVTRGKKAALVESADAGADVNGVPLTSGYVPLFSPALLFHSPWLSLLCFLSRFPIYKNASLEAVHWHWQTRLL